MGWFDILLVRDFCAVRSDFRDSFDASFFSSRCSCLRGGLERKVKICIINGTVQNLAYAKIIIFSMNKN